MKINAANMITMIIFAAFWGGRRTLLIAMDRTKPSGNTGQPLPLKILKSREWALEASTSIHFRRFG
jgi:hypothetical protein